MTNTTNKITKTKTAKHTNKITKTPKKQLITHTLKKTNKNITNNIK